MTEGSDRLDQLVLELKETRTEMRASFAKVYMELHGEGERTGYGTRIALLEAQARANLKAQEENAKRASTLIIALIVAAVGAFASGAVQVYSVFLKGGPVGSAPP